MLRWRLREGEVSRKNMRRGAAAGAVRRTPQPRVGSMRTHESSARVKQCTEHEGGDLAKPHTSNQSGTRDEGPR